MKLRITFVAFLVVTLLVAAAASAGPIIKPKKYHGPIPRGSITLRAGILAEATNAEMYDYIESLVPQPAKDLTESSDFGNAPMFEITYTYKLHPQFAVRGNFYAAFLTSSGSGVRTATVELPDTTELAPTIDYNTSFDVDLFTLEASALYYFTDAAVREFQPYIGGGFSFGVPHQKFKETQTIRDPDEDGIWQAGETLRDIDKDEWSVEAGVHGLLGALYYFGNRWAVSVEGRGQLLQSKFPLQAVNEDGELEDVNFVTDFSGWILSAGVSYAF
jgi:outer membrane protein W